MRPQAERAVGAPGAGSRQAIARVVLAAYAVVPLVLTLSPDRQRGIAGDLYRSFTGALRDAPGPVTVHQAEAAANIALFVPLSLLVCLSFPSARRWLVFASVLALSIGIEALQGFVLPDRVLSARDVLMNGLGSAVGVGIAALVSRDRPVPAD